MNLCYVIKTESGLCTKKGSLIIRSRAKITSYSLFTKTLKTLGVLQTECELIFVRSLITGAKAYT